MTPAKKQYYSPLKTPGNPDESIVALVREFQTAPFGFFHERELHARFYSLCHDTFPSCQTKDDRLVPTFHHRYRTVWRYVRGHRYAQRHRDIGSPGVFDFVVLRYGDILNLPYTTVLNETELHRATRRAPPEYGDMARELVQCAVELKLAETLETAETTVGDVARLEDRMMTACCKVAADQVSDNYVLGFSRGPMPDLDRARMIIDNCLRIHQTRAPEDPIRVLVATPEFVTLGGDWAVGLDFPNLDPLPAPREDCGP